MFGQNEIHGRKTFQDHIDLLVTSIFYTLQGEGPYAGRPAVFLRLAHCNLACSFCDTNFSHGDWMPYKEVIDKIIDTCLVDVNNCVLVITGGEPSLQAEALTPLLTLTSAYFSKVQIESNGLIPMNSNLPYSVYLVVSPKCTEGNNAHYLKPPNDTLRRADCLKFVITANKDSPYHSIPDWAFDWRRKRSRPIYVSPMAEYKRLPDLTHLATGDLTQRSKAERVSFWESELLDFTSVRANHEYAARYCLEHGLYLTMQMQLFTSLA